MKTSSSNPVRRSASPRVSGKPAKAFSETLLEIYHRLYALYGDCVCPLQHQSPFQLMVAVVLSAQCRDDRVNVVTQELFRRFPDAETMAEASVSEVANLIRSLGLFQSKAEHLVAASQLLKLEFAGKMPQTMEELTRLPGVGRKSANVILGNAFGIPGFPVDTHVKRLTRKLGLTQSEDPVIIEREITSAIAPEYWTNFSHLLIWHGRRVCDARKPQCQACVLAELCPAAATLEKSPK